MTPEFRLSFRPPFGRLVPLRAVAFAALIAAAPVHTVAAAPSLAAAAQGAMASFVPAERGVDVGDLSFVDGKGQARSLADWKGRTVLFNLWATWCAPCRAEMPHLDALQSEMGGAAFEVVTVSIDRGGPKRPRAMFETIGLPNLAFYQDAPGATFKRLKAEGLTRGLPITLLVGPDGRTLGSLAGPADWAGEDARNLIRTALEKNS